jgi:hypothetical protein
MICPKCGFEQPDGGLECRRCGIIFSRHKTAAVPGLARPLQATPPASPRWRPGVLPEEGAEGQLYGGPDPDWALPGGPAPAPAGAGAPGGAAALGGAAGFGGEAGRGGAAGFGGEAGPGESGGLPPPAGMAGGGGTAAAATAYGGGTGKVKEEPAVVGMALRPPPVAGPSPGRPAGGPSAGWAGAGGAGAGGPGAAAPPGWLGAAPGIGGFSIAPAFNFGQVLGDTFSIFFGNLAPFLLIAAAVISPVALVVAMLSSIRGPGAYVLGALILVVAEGLLTTPLVTGAITFGVAQELRGREASIGDCLSHGLSSVWRVFAVAFLQAVLIFCGMLACIVPGVIAAVVLSVAVPAALEEGGGAVAALRRSANLTTSHLGTVLGVVLTLGVIQFGLAQAVALLVPPAPGASLFARSLPALALSPVTTCLQATAAAVMYYRLRSSKEGIDVAAIASVFD